MRTETSLVNYILQLYYPNDKFKVNTKTPTSYMHTEDRVLIEVLSNKKIIPELIQRLQCYSKEIGVGKRSDGICKSYQLEPEIFNCMRKCWIKVKAKYILIE